MSNFIFIEMRFNKASNCIRTLHLSISARTKLSVNEAYTLLNVRRNPTDEELKKAFSNTIRQNHPDTADSQENRNLIEIETIKAAHEIIKEDRLKKNSENVSVNHNIPGPSHWQLESNYKVKNTRRTPLTYIFAYYLIFLPVSIYGTKISWEILTG